MSETKEIVCGFDWGLGEDATIGVLLDKPPDGHAYTIREIVFQREGPPVLRYDLASCTGEDGWAADVDAELTGLNAWFAGGGVMLHDRCKNLMRGLAATGIICSPTWVLNQDDDEGEDEHDNEADGLVKCGDCKGSGWYIGLNAREHCTECDGAGWVPK